jgi:alanyl-tRNA synthetase
VDTGMGLERTLCILNGYGSVYETDLFAPIIAELEKLAGKKYFGNSQFTIHNSQLNDKNNAQNNSQCTMHNAQLKDGVIHAERKGDEKNKSEIVNCELCFVNCDPTSQLSTFNFQLTKAFRVVADHLRTSVFMLGDERGIVPSNVDQGYVLRRLIRRAVRYGRQLGLPRNALSAASGAVVKIYADAYPEIAANAAKIAEQLKLEEERFEKTLTAGLKEFEKAAAGADGKIDGQTAFHLYDTYGFPLEMTVELAAERNIEVDAAGFDTAFAAHQSISQAGSEQRFKGGLADASADTAALHTATHLLHAALRKTLSGTVEQRGSNITAERLRFDFCFPRKVEPDELRAAEKLVNEAIAAAYPIVCEEMTVDEAKASGAIGIFTHKYGDRVKVYTIGPFSKEICGGPHAANTGDLGVFAITKEESSSAGVRRIKAELRKG